jgi:hypothetical protein
MPSNKKERNKMKVEFVGKLNIDAVARKLIEIADTQIVKDEKGNYVWIKDHAEKQQ